MAKAHFHKMQRVYVKPVGTWALVEQVIPHWVKDVAEPLKVTYECGLGRPFQASELVSEQAMHGDEPSNHDDDLLLEHWRIGRRSTKWRTAMGHHSGDNSGTFPVVLTDESDVGGWRADTGHVAHCPQDCRSGGGRPGRVSGRAGAGGETVRDDPALCLPVERPAGDGGGRIGRQRRRASATTVPTPAPRMLATSSSTENSRPVGASA